MPGPRASHRATTGARPRIGTRRRGRMRRAWRRSPPRTTGSGDAGSSWHPESIADSPDGLDVRGAGYPVEVLTQQSHIDIDDVRGPVIGPIPDVTDDLGPRQDVIPAAHEELKHGELACR